MVKKKQYLLVGKNKTRLIKVGDNTQIVEAYFRPDIREIIQLGQDGQDVVPDSNQPEDRSR